MYLELHFLWAQSLLVELPVWRSDVTVHAVSILQKVQLWSRASSCTLCTTYPSDVYSHVLCFWDCGVLDLRADIYFVEEYAAAISSQSLTLRCH